MGRAALGVPLLLQFFSSDVRLTAEEIVRFYSARFVIETGFRDAKQNFGFSTYQVRSKASLLRVVHRCLWAQTLLRLRCWDARPEPVFGEWRSSKPLSYLTLSQQKRWSQRQEAICAGSLEMVGVAQKTEPLPLAT